MDYTELVKKLRYEATWRDDFPEDKDMLLQAADAIEALQRACANYAEQATEQEWIPVTEQPKPGQYLVHKLYDNGYGEYHSYDILTFTDNLNKVDKYDFHGKEYKRPGWFDYDSEYGHFECGDNITHYMPLPQPPKEEPKIISAVDCKDCRYYPPSSLNGKPCTQCDMGNPLMNCFSPKEETE